MQPLGGEAGPTWPTPPLHTPLLVDMVRYGILDRQTVGPVSNK